MQNMEFQCPNCMHAGLLFERTISVITDVFDIQKDNGHIVSYQLDKTLHGNVPKKVVGFCSKCGYRIGDFESPELLLKHLLDNDYLVEVTDEQ